MNDNIFLSTYNHLNDLVDKCIKEHKDHKYPDGIICDTRYIAEITHKRHDHVLRDIDELITNLNNQGRRTFREVAKFGPVAENQGENTEVAKFEAVAENQGEINLNHEFRIIDYPNMSDKEIADETERIYKENNSRIKELINNFKQKYENKNILN